MSNNHMIFFVARSAIHTEPPQQYPHVAYLALGSNVGDRVVSIQAALRLVCEKNVQLLSTSVMFHVCVCVCVCMRT
jgi:hypothetical protein